MRPRGSARSSRGDVVGMTHAEIAAIEGCTKQNIAVIEKRAMAKLRAGIEALGLEWDGEL